MLIQEARSTELEIKEIMASVCREFLTGTWSTVSSREVNVVAINQNHMVKRGLDPLVTESLIFALLGEKKLGPKLLGVFHGGRVEEFVLGNALTTTQIQNIDISDLVARQMALIHSQDFPICKRNHWMWDLLKRSIKELNGILVLQKTKVNATQIGLIEELMKINFEEEYEWAKWYIDRVSSPFVFTHNDMNLGNVILSGGSNERKVTLIDFEYGGFNFRGYDLANHLNEWAFSYSKKEYPYYEFTQGNLPTRDQKIGFLSTYAQATGSSNINADIEILLREVEVFEPLSHLFWSIRSVVNSAMPEVRFGYLRYAVERMRLYNNLKSVLIKTSGVKRKHSVIE